MFPKLPPITKNIIILNVILYIVTNIAPGLYDWLSGFYPESYHFKIWQIITHMFMHAQLDTSTGLTHILFNMFTLWSFGPVLEYTVKEKKYVALYFLSGFGAFFLFNLWSYFQVNMISQELANIGVNTASIRWGGDPASLVAASSSNSALKIELLQQLQYIYEVPMVGASGAIFGVMAAFVTLYPNSKMMILFLPFPIKSKYLFTVIILVSLYLVFTDAGGNVAHMAHIGGALVGWLMARQWKKHLFRFK